MRFNAVPRSGFRGLLSLFALTCGAALITAGCGGGGSPLPTDAGSGGKTGTGGGSMGGSGMGGSGTGGSSMGGSGMGGAGMGGSGVGGAMDAGMDVNVCPDGGSTADSDGDGTPDCLDVCPNDPLKQDDIDSDGDGVKDCQDACPYNQDLTTMGVCGCVTPVDTDGDGTPDCTDGCPFDGNRTAPGVCGCGVPDNTPLCLVHRYSFSDTTTTIADSVTIAGVSPKNGMGSTAAVVPSGGKLTLAGGATATAIGGQWVTLPAGTVSTIGNSATFEAWVAWTSVAATQWQRIFDFGNNANTDGTPGTGQTYIFLSPFGGSSLVRAAITLASNGGNEDIADGTGSLPMGPTPLHVAVVVDDANLKLTLYVNGVPNGTPATLRAHGILSQIKDVNNYLGRSQWPDPLFTGIYDEFRIYSKALSAAQIAEDFARGPDVVSVLPTDGGTTTDAGTPDAGPDAPSDAPSGQ